MAQITNKAFGVTHIKSYIPLVLDMQKMNYDAWRELVETHCLSFGVSGHLDGTSLPANAEDTPWKERDGLVKMSIYGTISSSLLDMVLKTRCSARDLWVIIENLFRDNKEAWAIQLENELCTLTIGDMSIHDYCQKLKNLTDLLANVDSPVTDRAVVMHMLNGLSEKFDNIHNVIKHRSPFPSFSVARSMLLMEEDRISKNTKSSTPQVLHVATTQADAPSPQPSNNRGGQQPQQYNQGNYRNNQNIGRGKGRNNNYRGRGRNNWNSNQSGWVQQPST